MSARYELHSDFCPWHVDQRDSDCRCGETGPRDPHLGLIEVKPGMWKESTYRPRAKAHADNCDWHLDQYDWECTCGAVPNPEAKRWPSLAGNSKYAIDAGEAYLNAAVIDAALSVYIAPHQSRIDSLMESITNIVIGLIISQVANLIIIPLVFGIPISAGQNFTLAVFYTAVSLARSYSIRRVFNGRTPWAAIRAAFA